MCFAADARPPELPADLVLPRLAGGAAAERVTLTSADGTAFAAAIAQTGDADARVGVVILPDVRGLYRFYEELAERFAAAGRPAIVLDYFGRTAGVESRDDDFEYWPHVRQTSWETIRADIDAAIDALRDRTGVAAVVVVGFCFGGTNAFLAATDGALPIAGAVGFYGGLDPAKREIRLPSPVDRAGETRVPVLALFGGADESIPQERVDAFAGALAGSGAPHEVHVYPGAPHSFFDRSQDQHADASADAWRRLLAFLDGLTVAR